MGRTGSGGFGCFGSNPLRGGHHLFSWGHGGARIARYNQRGAMPKFSSASMAESYAKARPPLHARIVAKIGMRAAAALDVGCGAGLSTAPLLELAGRVVGVDPVPEMVKWGGRVARGANFAAARAEALPFRDASFDLITAAGSLNYADPARAFPELRRVIAVGGTLCVYDFSQDEFEYERAADGAIPLSPEILARVARGFRVARSERFRFPVTMDMGRYVEYLRSEGVYVAMEPWGPGETVTLRFSGYLVWLTPASL
jgi:ubiquinone/menaquinone biosynthesis C-methylase UbiE